MAKEEKSKENKQSKKMSKAKMGKIFLIVGIVLAQIGGAYLLVNAYYPEMYEFTSQFKSSGGVYYNLDNIIINPANSNGERYLIISLTVELEDENALQSIETKNAAVRERVNLVMSNHTASELSALGKRDLIKKELGIAINTVTDKKAVRNLFFTKYVLQ